MTRISFKRIAPKVTMGNASPKVTMSLVRPPYVSGLSWILKTIFPDTDDQTYIEEQVLDTEAEGISDLSSGTATVYSQPTKTDPFIKISSGRMGKGSLGYGYEYLRSSFTPNCGMLCKINDEIIVTDGRACRSSIYATLDGSLSLQLNRGRTSDGAMIRELKAFGVIVGEALNNYAVNDIDEAAWIFGGQNLSGDFGVGASYTYGLMMLLKLHGASNLTIAARFFGDPVSGASLTTLSGHAWNAAGAIKAYLDYFHIADGDAVTQGLITPYFLDNYNGTNGDDIVADHSPDTGADWAYGLDGFTIEGNELVPKALAATIICASSSGDLFNSWTAFTEYIDASNYGMWKVIFREQDTLNNWRVQLDASNGNLYIYEKVAGAFYNRAQVYASSLDKTDNVEFTATLRADDISLNVIIKTLTETLNLNYTSASNFIAETKMYVVHGGVGSPTLRGMKRFALWEIGNSGEYSAIGDYS